MGETFKAQTEQNIEKEPAQSEPVEEKVDE